MWNTMGIGRRCPRYLVLGAVLAAMLLTVSLRIFALDPALDVSQYAHTTWKIREGFTQGEIYSIAQTPDGYLWLGTEFGLFRFDGVRNVPWELPLNKHRPRGPIRSLLAARDGTLWIGADKGFSSWKDGKLTEYPELAGLYIFDLLEDRAGTVWVAAVGVPTGKLCAIHNGSLNCHGEDGMLGRGVARLYEDRKGNLWAGVENGVWRWKPGPPKFYLVPGQFNGIQGLNEDDDGTLLVAYNGGIRRFVDGKIAEYPLLSSVKQPELDKILRDRDGGLWISTFQGLVHMHQGRTDVFTQSDGLSNSTVTAVFEDREGNIWVGTSGGLDRFREFVVPTFSVNEGLSHATVESVLADRDGSVWLSTVGGLNQWKKGQITIPRTGSPKRDGKLNGLSPHSLFQDNRGRIWVSTARQLGYLENGLFVPIRGVSPGFALSIVQDHAGNMWVANEQVGLVELHERSVVQQIRWSSLGAQSHASVLAADPAKSGVWIGFFLGGIVYFEDGQIRASYTAAEGLGEGRVGGLQFDRDGTLWAATAGGLSRLKNGRIATIGSQNGLPCDTVNWMIEDDDHALWLYMACGLVRIDRSELNAWTAAVEQNNHPKVTIRAAVFDSFDGVRSLAGAGHFGPQVAKTSDGRIWFLPWDGVSVVDPRHLFVNSVPPPVHIEQITVDHKTYDATAGPNGRVRLPPLAHDLQIDYTALSLAAPEKVLFRYKLEGWDGEWQDAGTRRQAFYSNLPPRNYTFRVRACNNSGVWNEAGTFLDFSVAPAYYQTTWFRLTCVATFLALLWGLYQFRLRQLAREFNAGLEARVNERTRIARELHDSLLQGFQGLMFRLQAVRNQLPERPNEAMKALDIALERGDKAIAEGRDTVSDLREPIVGNGDIAQALTALAEELALQKNNAAGPYVRVLVGGKQRELDPVLGDEVYRIAREALRNAFLHGRANKIEAELTYGSSEFLLHVRDDGDGIGPEVLDQGGRAGHWGIPGMRERAEKFGGQVEVWSEQGAGTEIALSVPASIAYGKSHARRRFWFWREKVEVTDGQQSQDRHRS